MHATEIAQSCTGLSCNGGRLPTVVTISFQVIAVIVMLLLRLETGLIKEVFHCPHSTGALIIEVSSLKRCPYYRGVLIIEVSLL